MYSSGGLAHTRLMRASPGAPLATPRAEPEKMLGPWRLVRLLHRGQQLDLYRARPDASKLGPGPYVIKVPRPNRDGALAAALLRREAAVAAEVSHPHVSAVLGGQWTGSQPHLALPYWEGVSLGQLLAAFRPREGRFHLPATFALWIARQLASSLAALYAAGWLHGQVRPEHAIVAPQGHATLIDLSQARRLDSAECAAGLAPPTAPAYAAPETFAGCGVLTPASDVYSLGIVLFELLAGRLPLVAAHPRDWAQRHRRQPADVRELRPAVSHDAAELLRRMLAKEPLRRPAAAEMVDRLAGLEIEELL